MKSIHSTLRPKQGREYARHLRDDAHMRAGFAWFRAFPKDIAGNTVNGANKLTLPVHTSPQNAPLARRRIRILVPLLLAILAILAAVLYPPAASSSTSTARHTAKPTAVLVHSAFAERESVACDDR